jgi:TPR repeat protein
MQRESNWRIAIVFGILAALLSACTEPVKTETPEPAPVTAQAALQSAKDAYQRQDYPQAVEWFRKAAELGDAKGQYSLGVAYNEGKGVPQDYAQAAQWFRKAAEQGVAQAQNNLGFLYQQGQGVPKDLSLAAQWFRKAAEQGFPQAQKNLGFAYRDGQGVKKDPVQAAAWLRKAAAQGDAEAQAALKQSGQSAKKPAKTDAKPKTATNTAKTPKAPSVQKP